MDEYEIRNLAKWHNVEEDDLINHVRKSNNESNENTELLTLKAMTVLFVVSTIKTYSTVHTWDGSKFFTSVLNPALLQICI